MIAKKTNLEETNFQSPWRNAAFCFRFSMLIVLIWFVISSIISLVIYFSQVHQDNTMIELITEFSTWLFALPSIAMFGLINALPLMIPWLMKPLEEDFGYKEKSYSSSNTASSSISREFNKSYVSMTAKLEENLEKYND